MKIAYISAEDLNSISSWSGTPYHIVKNLKQHGATIIPIHKLKRQLPLSFKIKRALNNLVGKKLNLRFHPIVLAGYTKQIMQQLNEIKPDAILINDPILAANIKTTIPIYIWGDTLYAGMLAMYPPPSSLSRDYVNNATKATTDALHRCRYVIMASNWSANLATDVYGIHKNKVCVIPFGANIDNPPTADKVVAAINQRTADPIKLIFIGKEWERKGGDIVFAVAMQLHKQGRQVMVNFIGCQPPDGIEIPHYISCLGFISKHTEDGRELINRLFLESHFLFVPSRAEAYGIVFCEANAFGLPCITTQIGGIPTIVKNNINGMTFSLGSPIESYCEYITSLIDDIESYRKLALSAYNEYQQRLNWQTATRELLNVMANIK